jgi:hypothetical protein
MDDSGKLNKNEKWTVYAGLVFTDKNRRGDFIRKYKNILNDVKCKYCAKDPKTCDKECPEIKSNMPLNNKDRIRFMSLIKKEFCYAVIISNYNVYERIMKDKAARGRFSDYSIKLVVKSVIQKLLYDGQINRNDEIRMYLYFDEQPTVTNGYYNLKDSIKEELLYGIQNFSYNAVYRPVLGNSLDIQLKYFDSRQHYDIQASDILAGTVRRIIMQESSAFAERKKKIEEYLTVCRYLP